MILGTYPPRSAEWHEARRWRVGGSDVAIILGHSPYKTSTELLREKLNGDVLESSERMHLGTDLEDGIATHAARKYGWTYDDAASIATYVHDEHGWALANPDRVTVKGELVEIKTTTNRSLDPIEPWEMGGWGNGNTANIPLAYAYQTAWTCGVLGLDRWSLVVLSGGHNGRPELNVVRYRGKADPAIFARLITYCGRWHARLIETRDRTTTA